MVMPPITASNDIRINVALTFYGPRRRGSNKKQDETKSIYSSGRFHFSSIIVGRASLAVPVSRAHRPGRITRATAHVGTGEAFHLTGKEQQVDLGGVAPTML